MSLAQTGAPRDRDAVGGVRAYQDYRPHVPPQLLDQNDGPMLEGLKELQGLGVFARDYPDRDRLSLRFERFGGVLTIEIRGSI